MSRVYTLQGERRETRRKVRRPLYGTTGDVDGGVGGVATVRRFKMEAVRNVLNIVVEVINFLAREHEHILQVVLLMPLCLMALYIVFVEQGQLIRPVTPVQ